MQVRKLEHQELFDAHRIMAVAFEGEFDPEKERESLKNKKEPEHPGQTWGAFEEGALLGCFDLSSFPLRFHGHHVQMGGVCGVSNLPPYRRKVFIRACMQSAFQSMYQEGCAFSFLYPFSTAYYRQFGFENGAACQTWTLPILSLKLPDAGGAIEQLFPGDDLSPLLEIYNSYYKNFNLSVLRNGYDASLEKENWLNQKRYLYLWRDESGVPRSFLLASRDGEILDCTTDFARKNGLLFTDARSLQALLHFVYGAFSSHYKSIRFTAPSCLRLQSLIPEMAQAECRWFTNGMVRAVHVEKVLSLCSCRGEGALRIEISDPLLEENRGVWKLFFAPGRENLVEKTAEAPDLSLTIGDFSTLICGIRSAEELPWMPAATVCNSSAPLDRVFRAKPCHVLDLF